MKRRMDPVAESAGVPCARSRGGFDCGRHAVLLPPGCLIGDLERHVREAVRANERHRLGPRALILERTDRTIGDEYREPLHRLDAAFDAGGPEARLERLRAHGSTTPPRTLRE